MTCPPSANIWLYGSSILHPNGKQRFYIFKYASRNPGIWAAKNPDKIGVFAEHIFFMFLLWRSGWDSNPRTLADQTISSLVRTWYFRVCCGRWRQFWKRRKSLCCNGFRTHRPVLTSSISEKTRVQIEMRNAPKRSIFCTLARKYARRKPLSGMVLQTAPRIKCKKNRLKTDYTKRPFGPKHRKESSL